MSREPIPLDDAFSAEPEIPDEFAEILRRIDDTTAAPVELWEEDV